MWRSQLSRASVTARITITVSTLLDAKENQIIGCLLGTAVGDALGLPYEGLSRLRAQRVFGPPDRYRFLLHYGMVSDDTEQTCFVAQALLASGGEPEIFQRQLARRLRYWLLGLPAGIGLATGRAIFKLWVGFPPDKAGVFSAGNGPAMRSAIVGAAVQDAEQRMALVRASTRITHTDPKAEQGSQVVALAAQIACEPEPVTPDKFRAQLATVLNADAEELHGLLNRAVDSVQLGESTAEFAIALGQVKGVTGYVLDTVPVAIHAFLSHPRDFSSAVTAVIECGGDTDTSAAIVGGIVGAGVGIDGIPEAWIDGLKEWPRTIRWMTRLGEALAQAHGPVRPPRLFAPSILLRNLVFLIVVLLHGFRRLLPPY